MPGLYRTADEKRSLESRNGALQFLAVLQQIEEWKPGETRLTPELIRALQYRAIVSIYSCAGTFRDGPVYIKGVEHQPPEATEVPELVDQMCAYVNDQWRNATAIHLASFTLWRLNWIHPFFGGNGRTARAVSYMVLCARLGFRLPGKETIADHIVAQRGRYIAALQSADAAWAKGELDLHRMESLMESLLAKQLVSVIAQASGKNPL